MTDDVLHFLQTAAKDGTAPPTSDENDSRAVLLGLTRHEAVVIGALCASFLASRVTSNKLDDKTRAATAILQAITDLRAAYSIEPRCASIATEGGYQRISRFEEENAAGLWMASDSLRAVRKDR
jgi:hypothetical protein